MIYLQLFCAVLGLGFGFGFAILALEGLVHGYSGVLGDTLRAVLFLSIGIIHTWYLTHR